MQVPILSSTFLLTLLMVIGLVFFIRASTKDRIEVARLVSEQHQESILELLQQHFSQRAYRIAAINASDNIVTFEGMVRPSVFLAIFLTILAAVGILCLSLVMALLFPRWASIFPIFVILAPAAGVFYWRKSARPEQVLLRVEAVQHDDDPHIQRSLVTVTAHRDELSELRRSLPFEEVELGQCDLAQCTERMVARLIGLRGLDKRRYPTLSCGAKPYMNRVRKIIRMDNVDLGAMYILLLLKYCF
jgi:hypothetical protein